MTDTTDDVARIVDRLTAKEARVLADGLWSMSDCCAALQDKGLVTRHHPFSARATAKGALVREKLMESGR